MKFAFAFIFSLVTFCAIAQTDSSVVKKPVMSRGDSLYLARLNSTSNLMLAGGSGLCAIGGYLIYQGNKVYTTEVPQNIAEEVDRNHRQGIIYMAVGGAVIAGGIAILAVGAKKKVEFKNHKKKLSLQAGLLDNGNLGAMLTF